MVHEWQELTRMTQGEPIVIERVRMLSNGVAIEGSFELPALARLSAEDQIFVMAFVRSNGSIKDMERTFGISYPTVKNRLARIAQQLELVEVCPSPSRQEILAQLEHGEISAPEAIERLSR